MKKYIVFLSLLLFVVPAKATLQNGGFETGDLSNWTISVKYANNSWINPNTDKPVDYPFDPFTNPYLPAPSIITNILNPANPSQPYVSPIEGDYFLKVSGPTNQKDGIFTAPNGEAFLFKGLTSVSVSTSFSLSPGDVLSGWMALLTDDFPMFGDRAWVEIGSASVGPSPVAIPLTLLISDAFYNNIGGPNNPPYYFASISPWYFWEWTAPFLDTYTLSLNVYGDDAFTTNAFFDSNKITHSSVPEASTMLYLGFGLIGLTAYNGRKLKKS
jgi:hypothetical protein